MNKNESWLSVPGNVTLASEKRRLAKELRKKRAKIARFVRQEIAIQKMAEESLKLDREIRAHAEVWSERDLVGAWRMREAQSKLRNENET